MHEIKYRGLKKRKEMFWALSALSAASICHSRTKSQEAMGDHGGSPPSSGTKSFFYDSMTSVKSSKRNAGSGNKQGTRKITMGNWHGYNGGSYLRVDINGTSFPVNQANPLLGPNDLDLCATGDVR